eukprot:SAG31_NODE_48_length_30945_cov_16.254263_39_plen_133_part_00
MKAAAQRRRCSQERRLAQKQAQLHGRFDVFEATLAAKIEELKRLRAICQGELDDYEETVARGLPSKHEQAAARMIQRMVRGKLGRGHFAVANAVQQQLVQNSATRLQGNQLLFRFCAHYVRNTGLLSRDATH